jgi:hypothetical protein
MHKYSYLLEIIIAKAALYEPYPFLKDSARFIHSWELDHPVFTTI